MVNMKHFETIFQNRVGNRWHLMRLRNILFLYTFHVKTFCFWYSLLLFQCIAQLFWYSLLLFQCIAQLFCLSMPCFTIFSIFCMAFRNCLDILWQLFYAKVFDILCPTCLRKDCVRSKVLFFRFLLYTANYFSFFLILFCLSTSCSIVPGYFLRLLAKYLKPAFCHLGTFCSFFNILGVATSLFPRYGKRQAKIAASIWIRPRKKYRKS